jgi:hypothetical protein
MKNFHMHRGAVLFTAAAMWAASFAVVTPSFGQDAAPVDTARAADRAAAVDAAKAAKVDADRLSKSTDHMVKSELAITPAPAAEAIRVSLATLTESAVTNGGFKDVVSHFVDADRTRLGKYTSNDGFAKLNGRIDSFRKDWKLKYGEEFGFSKNANGVLGDTFARISEGEIGEVRNAAGKEVPPNEPKVDAGTAEALKKSGVSNTDANSGKMFGGDTNKEIGRNIATVLIPANGAMPELAIPMIRELPNSWQVDLPDNIDGQKLQNNLLKHLTLVDEDRVNWPSDSYEAYRIVARQVMRAVMESDIAPVAAGN